MHKLSTEELLEVYKEAIKSNVSKDFIILLSEEIKKRLITESEYEGLKDTFTRFNKFVEKGKDEDFGRGNSAYDNYYGDPTYKKPNLGAIEKAPFYACKFFPGDLGTKGGIIANEYGQALGSISPNKYLLRFRLSIMSQE
jgi:hypothetical protein